MNGGLFKTPEESALDDVTGRATELLEFCRSLDASDHSDGSRELPLGLLDRLDGHVDALMKLRQARGELPAMGNIERAQFDAAAVRLESLFSGEADAGVAAAKLAAACDELRAAIDAALGAITDEPLRQALDALAQDVEHLCKVANE